MSGTSIIAQISIPLTVWLGDIKKKSSEKEKEALKMTSQIVIFRAFFTPSPDPKSEKNAVNQRMKKSGLTALLHVDLINIAYLTVVPLSGHHDVALFE